MRCCVDHFGGEILTPTVTVTVEATQALVHGRAIEVSSPPSSDSNLIVVLP